MSRTRKLEIHMDVRRYKSTGRRSAKIEALVNNPVISSFYRACKFCFGSPSYHENSLEVSQGNFLHRADSPAPDSLAIPMVQVGDALVVACKPLLELTKEHRDIGNHLYDFRVYQPVGAETTICP